ncbi:MAG TPA: hypothetical protein VFU22_23820 [Roseiflexaceae bacterium]|nr:hypothetical protein [Roseiflexaceae bacterium]
MLIPMQRHHRQGAENGPSPRSSERIAHAALIRIEQRLARLKRVAVGCTRLSVIVLGVLAFHWSTFVAIDAPPLALAIALGCLGLALGYTWHYTGWPTLALDSLAIFCLLYATGGANSPLLALTLAPILIGGLLGNGNGVLAGTASGVSILLIVNILHRAPLNAIVFELVLLQVSCGLAVSWLWRGANRLLATLRDDLWMPQERAQDLRSQPPPNRAAKLGQLISECTTLDQLARLTTERAVAISGLPAQVKLTGRPAAAGSENGDPDHIQITIPSDDVSGMITLQAGSADLSFAQREALDHLACMVGQRAAVLRHLVWQQRQRAAIATLWEISGLLRIASTSHDCVRHGLLRLAEALGLDWLTILAPNQLGVLAPLIIARGHGRGGVPTLNGAQLRVATEALRGERPLIRTEGAHVLICLPICLTGHAPIVVAAYDTVDDAATQALLMLFGNLIAERLTADRGLSAQVLGIG